MDRRHRRRHHRRHRSAAGAGRPAGVAGRVDPALEARGARRALACGDVRIAVDPAATAASAITLAIDRGGVSRPVASRASAAATGPTAGATAIALGDEVLRNLRLLEVVVVPDRGERPERRCRRSLRRHAELRIPDRAEGRRPGTPRGFDEVLGLPLRRNALGCDSRLARLLGSRGSPAPGARRASRGSRDSPPRHVPRPRPRPRPPRRRRRRGSPGLVSRRPNRRSMRPPRRPRRRHRPRGAADRRPGRPRPRPARASRRAGRRATRHRGRYLGCRRDAAARSGRTRCARGPARPLGAALPRSRATTASAAAGSLGLLVRDLGHRQVLLVLGDPPAGARGGLLDLREMDDVRELVRDVDQVGRRVAAEADDLDPDAHLLDGPDRRGEVPVARHDDRDVEVPGGLHHVDDELDVEVRLDLAVARTCECPCSRPGSRCGQGTSGSCAGSRCPGPGPCTRRRARGRDPRWPTSAA